MLIARDGLQHLPWRTAEVFSRRTPTPMKLHRPQEGYGESGPTQGVPEKYGLTLTHVAQAGKQLPMQSR